MENFLKIAIGLTLFGLKLSEGLNTTTKELTYLKTKPSLLRRSLLAVDVLVPLVAFAIVIIFQLPRGIAVAILLVAASPGSPLSSRKVFNKGGIFAYGASLHLIVLLLSVITTPITLKLFFAFDDFKIDVSLLGIVNQIMIAQLIPLGIGIFIHQKFPSLGEKIVKPITIIANLALIGIIFLILVITFKFVLQIDFSSLLAIVLVVASSLGIGHLFGGRNHERRHTLALVCASRNIGLAVFIASSNFPINAILPNLIPYLFFGAIVEAIYLKILNSGARSAGERVKGKG
ncbi:bile acid:sodium symporter family protein [Gloeocapsa sp. PCC 73106]|uniref:bile acid:sodium symporter family protein n=1 Tax=Gloeocapsa sp. PCC 73106 TaxID=102232 RepID=UPI0002ABDEB5|nr:Na+-dependent transporter [Gloeocapsa sp. PCC 73106]ELR97293.1 putative Na+-dependent transporter [Gloeocapsa sp. PCC 73106]